jgi:hypothetical protein
MKLWKPTWAECNYKKRVLMPNKKGPQQKRKTKKGRRISDSQTNQPFEKDSKHRLGEYGGAGEPPLKK